MGLEGVELGCRGGGQFTSIRDRLLALVGGASFIVRDMHRCSESSKQVVLMT
jgi:hypothetical protein